MERSAMRFECGMTGEAIELSVGQAPNEMEPYERLIGDALIGPRITDAGLSSRAQHMGALRSRPRHRASGRLAQAGADAGRLPMTARCPVVFLVDVDNTLIDNDRSAADLKRQLEHEVGHELQANVYLEPVIFHRGGS